MQFHVSVLLNEVVDHLQPKPNQIFIDGTVGQGGHAEAILERILPDSRQYTSRLLAIDRDFQNLATSRARLSRFGEAVTFVHDSYANIGKHVRALAFPPAHGILLDLGFASSQIDDPARGFSFRADGPLDMRYDTTKGQTATDLVNELDEEELARLFRLYGEEKAARPIAQAIVKERRRTPIDRTAVLAEIVARVVRQTGPIHPATRVFQALRIAVNDEFGELERALPEVIACLQPAGRVAIITFHSLEDRIVKNFFRTCADLRVVNKRVIVPSRSEVVSNPRSRSAKLRVAERI